MLRNSLTAYGRVAILLHWLLAVLIAGQLVVGLTMVHMDDQRLSFELIQWHKSFGFLILALVILRLGWRLANRPPALPTTMPAWEQNAASLSHRLLYGLMLFLPLTGWVLVSASVLAIPTYAFYLVVIPHLPVPVSEAAEDLWSTVHQWLAYALIAVVALHIVAALHHHFILRDGVLLRMLRPAVREERPDSRR